MRFGGWKKVCAIFLFCAVTAMVSSAQVTFTTLVTFDGTDGQDPSALVQGADGGF